MIDSPRVSVVIPTFNRGKVIERSIRSVINQTFQDIEIIIVDDCSTDDTRDIVAGFKDKRIKYICHKQNKGGAVARNTGINAARGEFIAFQDSDDVWVNEKLEKQMQVMSTASNDVGVVFTSYLLIKNNRVSRVPRNITDLNSSNFLRHLLRKNFIGTPTVVIRKICLKKVELFDEDLPRYQDWDLFIRLARYYKFIFLDEPLVTANFLDDSITADNIAAITARKRIFDKNRTEIINDNKLLADYFFDTGKLICKYGQYKEGKKYIYKSIMKDYLNTRHWPAALVSIFGQKAYMAVSRYTTHV